MAARRVRRAAILHHHRKDGDELVIAGAEQKNKKTGRILALIGAFMLGLAFAAVPLYRMFCEATGFNGTTQRADHAPGAVAGQVKVQFDANVHPGLPWRFEPEQTSVEVAPGAQTKIFYRAQNLSARAIVGQAVYNVSPDTVGKYFKKIQCFCFSEQTLQPGQKVDMPVVFFVDPKIKQDPDTKDVHEITLSYTFYPVETVQAAR
jgi:cytochrome c oxidase assembly protein subunit 11